MQILSCERPSFRRLDITVATVHALVCNEDISIVAPRGNHAAASESEVVLSAFVYIIRLFTKCAFPIFRFLKDGRFEPSEVHRVALRGLAT